MSLCMNLSGGPKRSDIGLDDATIGSRRARSRSTLTEAGIGPTPDEPVIVMCGGLYRASFGSNRSLMPRMTSPAFFP